jgi:hypothetical protein
LTGVGDYSEDELNRLLASKAGKSIKNRIKEIEQQLQEEEMLNFTKQVERSGYHDTLVDICVSAFGPESKCYNDLGYVFVSSEPLLELGVKNFDVLIYNQKTKHAIFVQCKSSISNPGRDISDSYEALEKVTINKIYLEEKLGDEIRTIEFVICIPAEKTDRLVRELERREKSGEIDKNAEQLLLVWQVNKFEGQILQLFTRINSRDKPFKSQHTDNTLTKILADGIKVESEVLIKTYPSSHPLKQGGKIVVDILAKNKISDMPLTEFSKGSVELFCQSPTNIAHYAYEIIGKNISDHFLGESKALGLIEAIEGRDGWFRFKIEGKTIKTTLSNYQKLYQKNFVNRLVKEKAVKKAVQEYRKNYPELFTFE